MRNTHGKITFSFDGMYFDKMFRAFFCDEAITAPRYYVPQFFVACVMLFSVRQPRI